MEKLMNIPTLRFPEFDGEWELKKLGEVATFLDGRRKPIKSSDRHKIKGEYPYYGASGIIDYINDYIFDEEIILLGEDGENIISRNLPLAFKVVGKCWINNHAHVLKPKQNYEIDFLTQLLENVSYVQYNTGTAQPKLNQEICRSIPLFFTSYNEQTKIASFLTTVDDKLQALKQKKNLLEQYKKGVMQQIFSQEIRFKDDNGNEYPDWEEKKLGEICEITIGEFVIKTKQNPHGKYPVFNGGKSYTGLYDEFNKEGNKIIISARGANAGFVNFQKEKYWAGNSCYSIDVLDKKAYNILYFFYFIKMFESTFTDNQQAANIPSVSKKDAENFKIQIPQHEEQTKIANFLSAIDDKISHCQEQIENTEVWKKGLLQQMFC